MNKYATLGGVLLFVITAFMVANMIYSQNNVPQTVSTFSLTPTPSVIPTKEPEPDVTTWDTYTNDSLNFKISYPDGWNYQEYKGIYGATQVAFSPNSLPCKDCSYVHDGYFSIKIYNATTDPEAYKDYTTRLKNVGKSVDYKVAQIADKNAVIYTNLVALENNGNIFEFSLDKDNGTDSVFDSKIFQKAVLSLTFTNLVFTN